MGNNPGIDSSEDPEGDGGVIELGDSVVVGSAGTILYMSTSHRCQSILEMHNNS